MGRESFLRNVGALPATDDIRKAQVVELKDNPENPGSDTKAGIEQELATLKAKVAELENGSKQDDDALSKVLTKLSDAIAEIKATVEGLLTANSGLGEKVAALEAKPEPASTEEVAALNGRVKELEDWQVAKAAEEAVDKDELCPACGANVNFKSLPIEKQYGNEVDIVKYLFGKGEDEDSRNVIGLYRQCPECGHKQPVSEEAEVSEV